MKSNLTKKKVGEVPQRGTDTDFAADPVCSKNQGRYCALCHFTFATHLGEMVFLSTIADAEFETQRS